MSRQQVGELPLWERQLLLGSARASEGIDEGGQANDLGIRADGSVDVMAAILARSDGE